MQHKVQGNERLWLLSWAVLALLVLVADYLTGPFIQLPILFLGPVTLAAWYSGRGWGMAMAVILPLIRISFSSFWAVPWTMLEATVNGIIQIIALSAFAFLVDQAAQRKALSAEVKMLRGILPICSFCKNIRNDGSAWEPLEKYISEHSDAEFSHGLCPECAREHYPEFFDRKSQHPGR
jgi:hypothetical protein